MHLACIQGNLELVKMIVSVSSLSYTISGTRWLTFTRERDLFISAKNKEGKTAYEISEDMNLVFHTEEFQLKSEKQN